jgi:hypothetical protein
MLPRRSLVVAAGLVLLPTLGVAQGAPGAARSHTVKRGDTLWDIAKTYLNDPFLWPEIYRANTDVVEDPHWIYPGEVLRIPDGAALKAPAPDELEQTPADTVRGTPAPDFADLLARGRTGAVRAGEYLAAPFISPVGAVAGSGRIVGIAEAQGTTADMMGRPLSQDERIFVTPPEGVRAVRGDRFLVVEAGDMVGRGQVQIPTAVVEIVGSATQSGGTLEARVRSLFSNAGSQGRLIPLDTLVPRDGVFPAPVADGAGFRVTWIQEAPLLPSLGRYLALDATARDGLVAGDQLALMRARGSDLGGERLDDELVAVVQVLRVTEQGTTGIIVGQRSVGIEVGMRVRLVAKMP